mmetsp:Transcript_28992/g.39824  ORF Transcript_28992/g.39824 Transcript_28992/m.39824 type:complete len:217 (+) Transcript_28992:202-852(+)
MVSSSRRKYGCERNRLRSMETGDCLKPTSAYMALKVAVMSRWCCSKRWMQGSASTCCWASAGEVHRLGSASHMRVMSCCSISFARSSSDTPSDDRNPSGKELCRRQNTGGSSLVSCNLSSRPALRRAMPLRWAKVRPQIRQSTPTVRCSDGPELANSAGTRVSVVCGKPAGTYSTWPGPSTRSSSGGASSTKLSTSNPLPLAKGSARCILDGAGGA